ncbi:transposase, partial [Verrucomicrobia bacterium]|nr:transposase [Verrucomicrobiota bacterium]
TLRDLAVNEYHKEHDMHVLKRLKPKGLRQGVTQGKRVLTVYDRAGVDFDYWRRCQKECAVYFLSRVKENMVFDSLFELDFDKEDPRNAGVQRDERVHSTKNLNFRVITYLEPETGQTLEFLTNVMDMEPGILVELYRRRWEIEKVFDDLKNKLEQKKSWSSDLTGKRSQGQLIALTYNLIRLLEDFLQEEHGIRNEAEEERKIQQRQNLATKVRESGRQISSLLENACKATQRSVKYIRWLRGYLRDRVAASVALPFLRSLYAEI